MQNLAKLVRIEPAFDDPEMIRALFAQHAPYRTIADYIPRKPENAVHPYFRGNWAVGGKPLVEGAESILHNRRFIDAARALFGVSTIRPKLVVVNLNAPMPPGPTHVDVPTFRGATREQYPLGWLIAMGRSVLLSAGASSRRAPFRGSMTGREATLNTGLKGWTARCLRNNPRSAMLQ